MMPVIHHFQFLAADGPVQMAVDELLLEKAQAGKACFRWYAWNPATLSIGYFQKHAEIGDHQHWSNVPWVRRCTGGGAIWHDEELTYALALPAAWAQSKTPKQWHDLLHETMTSVLHVANVPALLHEGNRKKPDELDYACFAIPQPGDVLVGGRKMIGSAQRLKHGALLQHGSILNPLGALLRYHWLETLSQRLPCSWQEATWSTADHSRIADLVREKYGSANWNTKR